MAAGALYKADLAHQMRSLGFDTYRTKDSFELAQIPGHVCEAQSSRSKAVEEALAQQGLDRSNASAVMKELITLGSREEKGGERVIRDFDRWQKENAAHGFGPIDQKEALATGQITEERVPFGGKSSDELASERLSQLTAKASTFNIYDVYRSMAEASICETNADGALGLVKAARGSAELVSVGPNRREEMRYSTREMARIEQDNMLAVAARRGENRHPVPEVLVREVLESRPTIKKEQADALRHLISGSDGVGFIEGDAGTGKSFMMAAVCEAYERSGYDVRGVSFTNKAAQNLEEGSGIKNCQSVDAMLIQQRKGENQISNRTVLVLDEAGMVGSRKIHEIMDICRDSGAKLVCVGDQKQIQPIAAGQAFGSMKRVFGGKRLSEIMRQKEEWLQNAIKDLAVGQTKSGLDELDRHNAIKISKSRIEARHQVIAEWSERVQQVGLIKAPLIVATTNSEVDSLNKLARENLVERGIIDQGSMFETEHGRCSFARGDRIVFTSNLKKKGIYNSSVATIENIKIPLNPKKSASLTVKTESGRRIRFDTQSFNHFRHAYAITAHKSQGSTVDQVMVLVDGTLMDREKFYVAVSRGRENPRVFADHQTLGGMHFEEKRRLSVLSEEERQREEHEFFKASLGRMVGASHEKDTSQDYPQSRLALNLALSQQEQANASSINRWETIKDKVSEQLRLIHERIATAFGATPEISPNALDSKNQPLERDIGKNDRDSREMPDLSYDR